MSQPSARSGAPRDVPPPRPVGGAGPGDPEPGSPALAAAARALAEAVSGLLGRDAGSGAGRAAAGRPAARVLADVVSAVAAAARASNGGAGVGRPGSGRGRPVQAEPKARSRWAPGGLLTDLLDAAAPALPIRDRSRLQLAYPGLTEQEIADALTARAARATGAIGAATGGLAAAQWFAPPSLVAVPLELGAETVLVAAVEVVLVGELHELYRRPAAGDARTRALAYLTSWSTQRAVGSAGGDMFSRLGSAGAQVLRRRVTRRLARGATSLAPLLVGATLAARGNRKVTVSLAERVLSDLRTAPPGGTPG
jgi:hypothetical protein